MLQSLARLIGRNGKLNVAARFELNKIPAKGSTSVVYRATEKTTGNMFALKLINPKKVDSFRGRFGKLTFESEGQIQLGLDLPGVVTVHEAGFTTDGQHYLLMDHIKAPTLEDYHRGYVQQKIPQPLTLVKQLSQTLLAIHQAGFVHRDLCARNIFLTDNLESCQIFDFGLAVPNKPEFNLPGNRTGCPLHMAPEIVRRQSTDHRVDVFAFGVVVYRLLTGHHPWGTTESNSKAALIHDTQPPNSILEHQPMLNKNLAKAVDRCLANRPDQRFADMKRFLIQAGGIKHGAA